MVAVRQSRLINTVVLNDKQKMDITNDINEFLNPDTCWWYSRRGILYRRGYLLSGPSGTEKTSLSFALAGVFGLEIYCMSLSELTLTEEDLIVLLNSLLKQYIVLLEDINSAGIGRKKADLGEEKEGQLKDKKALSDGSRNSSNNAGGITISGLLNAIDGVVL
jgi:mitochondrial chaperone BCS1